MSLLSPCDACGARDQGKNCWLAWAWNRADNTRVAWKQRICVTCVATNLAPLLVAIQEDPLSCPSCHISDVDNCDPIYLTYVLPPYPKAQAEFATCGSCAVEIRNRAQLGAHKLEDREQGVGASAPTLSGTEVWDSLGLRPRA